MSETRYTLLLKCWPKCEVNNTSLSWHLSGTDVYSNVSSVYYSEYMCKKKVSYNKKKL